MRSPYPVFLYDLAWDLFSVVRCWTAPPCTGPERGRLFEKLFYRYCDRKRLPLSETAGSRTLYRALVTATPVEATARVFAVQWGILLVEPHRVPLLSLYILAKRAVGSKE